MSTLPMNRGGYGQPEIQDISRQRKFAEQLRAQGAEDLKGQMVSGHYVAPSWTQQLAKVLQSGLGGYMENKADTQEKDYNATKSRKFAEILSGNKPRQVPGQPIVNTTMPAYEPEQQDRFGSPNVQRQPVTTETPTMTQESPEAMQARQQEAVLGYMQQYGNTPEGQYLLSRMDKQDDRAYAKGEKIDDRQYADTREEKLYNRNRQDKLSDVDAERKYQDIVRADQQGHQVSLQDRQFAQQFQMQAQSQKHTSRENALSRQQQAELARIKDKESGIDWKYDSQSDEFVAAPTPEYPMGRRSGNIAKANAGKSMEYVINQFEGDYDEKGKPIKGADGKFKNVGALNNTVQGGIMGAAGYAGAVFDSQDQKRFNNLKEQMSTELRTLFRIPGEGTLSDKEQAQYGIQLPDVKNDKKINQAILNDVRERIKLRNNLGANPMINQDQPTSNVKAVDW